MSGEFFLNPQPTFIDPNTQVIHGNATVTSSGSSVVSGYGSKEVVLIVNITGTPTGTTPTLTFTIQEVDPVNQTTVFGPTASTSAFSASGIQVVSLTSTSGGAIKLSWVITGTTPSFTGVNSSICSRVAGSNVSIGSVSSDQGSPNTLSNAWPVKVTDGTNSLPTMDVAARKGFQAITDGTNTATVTGSNALKVDGSAVIQPVSGTVTANAGTGTFTVGGTVTANIGTSGSLALDATLTGGTQRTRITDGTSNAAVKAASTAAIATDPALVVSLSPNSGLPSGSNTIGAVTQSGTWTVQPGNTANTTPWLATINQGGNSATVTGSNALKVDNSAVNQPVVGTGTDNTANSTAKLPVLSARANTSAPTWADGNMAPLSVDTSGALRITGSIAASNASIGTNNAAAPSSSTQIGGSDGTNLQTARVFDADSGAGSQYVLGVGLRKSASGGSVELGTATDPVRVDPTGSTTQPVSGTITANIGTAGSLALDATLTGGTQKAIVRGGAKGATTAADVTSTAEGVDHQSLDVQIYHGGTAKDPTAIRALTSSDVVTSNQGTAAALSGYWPVRITDGTNTLPTMDTVGRSGFQKLTDGTNTAAVKAASTAAIATDTALVVAISPNNTIALAANQSFNLSQVAGTNTVTGGLAGSQGVGGLAASGTSLSGNPVLTAGSDGTNARSLATDADGILYTSDFVQAIVRSRISNTFAKSFWGEVTTNATTRFAINSTAFVEQTAGAQRSINSASANDTAAGTGARTVQITYFTLSGITVAGPFFETLTLNGTTAVNTVATDICFVESIEVMTVGSTGSNVGVISLFGSTAGGGGTIASIAATQNTTRIAHHYVATGRSCFIYDLFGSNSAASGNSPRMSLEVLDLGTANAAEKPVFSVRFDGRSLFSINPYIPITVVGPARVNAYVLPNNATSQFTNIDVKYIEI